MTIGVAAAPASADQVRSTEWWLSSLGVSSVWPASQGAGVTVAVLSDGVDSSQPDLSGAVTSAAAIPGAPVAVSPFLGEQGTAIASLIAGRGHGAGSASGIAGVAPEAQILSVPVTVPPDDWQLGQTAVAAAIPAAIAAGIKLAVSDGATVIDLPADPGQPNSTGVGGSAAAAGGSAAEQEAVSFALDHNVVLVAPAGDNALTTGAVNYPAAYSGVIAVGAFDSAIDKPSWTSRGSYVTLTAAGAGVLAATNTGSYQPVNSTAAASAVVAGVVALIRSRYPGLSVADIRKALTTTTMFHRPNGLSTGSGYGALNAAKAYAAAAALGTPGKLQAGGGAEPRLTPRPAAAGAGAQSLTSQVLRASEISAGVLVLLLLVALGYALAGRRRRSAGLPAAMAAQWTAGQTQSRYPHAPLTDADRMLELFAAPAIAPDRPRTQVDAAGGSSATAARAGDFWQGPSGQGARPVGSGPASGTVTSRTTVSGTPPWEPAAEPAGEMPWNDDPDPQTPPGELAAPASPAGERWTADPLPASGRPTWDGWRDRPARAALPGAPEPASRNQPGAPPRRAEPASQPNQAEGAGEPGGSSKHRSGLPMREPRSVTPTPLSPSGSLWDRPEPGEDSSPGDATDAAGGPIFIWDQARSERR